MSREERPAGADARRGEAVLIAITAFWGASFLVVKDALGHSDPLSFMAMRFGVGAAVATALSRGRLFDADTRRGALVLGPFLFLGYVLQTYGLRYTTPARSAFLTGLSVLLVPGVCYALWRRVPRPATGVGIVLATVGLYLLTGVDAGWGGDVARGDVLTLGCAAAYAVHIALTEAYAPRAHVTGLVAGQLWLTALGSVLLLPFVDVFVEPSPRLFFAVGFTGIFASALAISLQTWGQARTTAVRAALIFALEPVFAALYSWWAGFERLTAREVMGGALIVAAVAVAEGAPVVLQRWRSARG
jgi:drug/metabolite transporter (DMT)-like permease